MSNKSDKETISKKGLTQSVKISIKSHQILDKFRREKRISMQSILDDLISFLDRHNFSISILDDRYELHQMNTEIKENHKKIVAILKRFSDDFLSKIEKNNDNNLEFLTRAITALAEIKTQEDIKVIVEQIYKLSRALVSGVIDDRDAAVLLKETLRAIQEPKKELEPIKTAQPEEDKYLPVELIETRRVIVEGTVMTFTETELIEENKKLCTKFWIRQPISNVIDILHKAILLEGDLTNKLNLLGEENIRTYFNSFNPLDPIKVDGYINTYTQGSKILYKTYVITDVISHTRRV